MSLTSLDYGIIIGFFALILFIGIYVSKSSGKNSTEYFLSGRNMPWWLLGFSMVATTFGADTPLLVADIVRQNGVAGNWVWWAFLLTGMLTVFVYAKLWRKSNVKTDIEFYELRYSGKPATFLRGFRALYLGVIFNVLVMSVVTLAAIKIGGVMLGIQPWEVVLYAGTITVIFSAIGGFKGVVYTDFILFFVAMIGAIGAAYYILNLPQVGGLKSLLENEIVLTKISLLPDFNNTELLITLLVIPLTVQWWSAWYPGSEPGGGGYVAQRMLAAKNENHAIGATFFFNILHYALRPWPWILVALASLVIFPDIASLQTAFPHIEEGKLGHDLAYPAMLNFLPAGLLGLVLASLIAAYMSTISSHLNWGSSYMVNDFYKRFVKPEASEKELVNIGRISTVLLMVLSSLLALTFNNALQVFNVIILFGAGTGLLFILRWFWWRINAWSEISAMVSSGIISLLAEKYSDVLFGVDTFFPAWSKYPLVVLITTLIWVIVTYVTSPEKQKTLENFYQKIQPSILGWKPVILSAEKKGINIVNKSEKNDVPSGILAMVFGTILVYSVLFATGNFIYGNFKLAFILVFIIIVTTIILIKLWNKIKSTSF
ncbi:sodium:solute symporter family protein [Urechidicola croceus]|uniref:Na+:solute symporter n=1 Tax=Urechidicola croceus TaxID=1850246 RepID=A0A1D8P6Q3_9FLAO|nr:sodium:solute symporter family protein [Urechidicola croceus]AOW20251.1 Na+:solute symporter [Urechidicola croceus]